MALRAWRKEREEAGERIGIKSVPPGYRGQVFPFNRLDQLISLPISAGAAIAASVVRGLHEESASYDWSK